MTCDFTRRRIFQSTPSRDRAALVTRLDAGGALARGQLVFLDADDMVALLGPSADGDAFEINIAARIRGLIDRFGGVRAFGEIVDVFWRRGDAHVPKPVEPDALVAIAAQLVRASGEARTRR